MKNRRIVFGRDVVRWTAVCRLACLVGAAVGCSIDAVAQAPTPSPHWGAELFPRFDPELRAVLTLDRFTEFDGEGVKFNDDIDESAGFNLFTLSWTDYLREFPELTFTLNAGGGVGDDQPTRALQNNYVHGIRDLAAVPVAETRNSTELVAGLSMNYWFDATRLVGRGSSNRLDRTSFVGGGYATGSIYQEAFLHIGHAEFFEPSDSWSRGIRVGFVERVAWPIGSDAYPDVADFSSTTQVSVSIVPTRIETSSLFWSLLGNPELGVTVTYDTGLFQNSANDPIDSWFIGLQFKWATGLEIETYNDMLGGRDNGPTMGVTLSFDLATLFRK